MGVSVLDKLAEQNIKLLALAPCSLTHVVFKWKRMMSLLGFSVCDVKCFKQNSDLIFDPQPSTVNIKMIHSKLTLVSKLS